MLALGPDDIEPIVYLAAIVGIGIGVQWIASVLHLPALLLLVAAGLLLGPVTGVLDPGFAHSLDPMISVAVAVILFEGGLSLHFDEARAAGPALGRLIVSGIVLGFLLVTALASIVAGLSLPTAAVLGAVLVVTGPTVILPMLRQARIARRPATLLKWEGIVNDPIGALLAVFVFQVATEDVGLGALPVLLLRALAAAALGAAAALLLGHALQAGRLPEHLKSPAILAGVLLVYVAAEGIGAENGLLAVTVMGLVLANQRHPSLADIRHFKEQVSVLLVSILFIVLSARLQPDTLVQLLGAPLVLIALILCAVRPLTVWAATVGTDIPLRERALLGWIAPRGVVAAAVAGEFGTRLVENGHQDGRLLVPIVFGVILATVVLHGSTIRPLARRLGLGASDRRGILIVGASTWALELARALVRAGADVVLTDTRYPRVSHARRQGLESHFGDVLSEEAELELPLERVSWVLAATDDDAYNSLVCHRFAREFGRPSVLQLTPGQGPDRRDPDHRLVGRTPWGEGGTYWMLASEFWSRRQQFKVTAISEEFGWDDLRAHNPGGRFLFWVTSNRLEPIDASAKPPDAAAVVWLEGEMPAGDAGAQSGDTAE